MRLLLTGCNGFIGSRVATDAKARGWQVIGVGRRPTPAVAMDAYLRHDLGHRLELNEPVDAIIHAAGLASPWAAPVRYERDNVQATRHVLNWAEEHGRPYFAYVSSSSVLYRDEDQFDLNEESPVPPATEQINYYSRSKLIGERLTAGYTGTSSVLRPRAVFGVGDTVLLPRVVTAARKGVLPRFTRPDGQPILADLVPVETVSAYLLGAVEKQVSATLNLVNGEQVDLNPFVDQVLAGLGLHPRRPRIPAQLANALAGAAELVSARLLNYAEPPITRYGIAMFTHSKTFDATKVRSVLGPPPTTVAQTLADVVSHWHG